MNASQPPNGVTRIDLAEVDGNLSHGVDVVGVRVKKWDNELPPPEEYRPRFEWGPPSSTSVNESLSLDQMCAWLEEHGYKVYEWPTGARAFWGTPHPIRSSHQIRKLKDRLLRRKMDGDPRMEGIEVVGLDLRFQW